MITPEAQILVRFALWLVVSEMQGQKSEMHQMTPNWIWTHSNQKYPVHTKYLPWGPYFGLFYSMTSGFEDMTHIIIPP